MNMVMKNSVTVIKGNHDGEKAFSIARFGFEIKIMDICLW